MLLISHHHRRRALGAALLALVAACGGDDPAQPGGGGGDGASVTNPVELGRIVTSVAAGYGGANVHNAWWYHDASGEKRYVFVGEEQPGTIGASSGGDIHVVDVSDFAAPREVAFYSVAGAGTHNFSVDEQRGILYAAYYNGGVRALNVRGDLAACTAPQKDAAGRCDLAKAGREVAVGLAEAATIPGVRNPYVWGVQYANDVVYASDMVNGLWKLRAVGGVGGPSGGSGGVGAQCTNVPVPSTSPAALPILGCGLYPDRFTAEVAVRGTTAYTTTWGARATASGTARGNAILVWDVAGAPTLVDSVVVPTGATTLGDVAVSPDGKLLVVAAEPGPLALLVYDLTNPRKPVEIGRLSTGSAWAGAHTAEIGLVNGRLHAFLAQYPGPAATSGFGRVAIVDLGAPASPNIVLAREFPGTTIHDTYYRDGLLFLALWRQGLAIWDLTGKKGA